MTGPGRAKFVSQLAQYRGGLHSPSTDLLLTADQFTQASPVARWVGRDSSDLRLELLAAALESIAEPPVQLEALTEELDPNQLAESCSWATGAVVEDTGAVVEDTGAVVEGTGEVGAGPVVVVAADAWPDQQLHWLQRVVRSCLLVVTVDRFVGSAEVRQWADEALANQAGEVHVLRLGGTGGAPLAAQLLGAQASEQLVEQLVTAAGGCVYEMHALAQVVRAGVDWEAVRQKQLQRSVHELLYREAALSMEQGVRVPLWQVLGELCGWKNDAAPALVSKASLLDPLELKLQDTSHPSSAIQLADQQVIGLHCEQLECVGALQTALSPSAVISVSPIARRAIRQLMSHPAVAESMDGFERLRELQLQLAEALQEADLLADRRTRLDSTLQIVRQRAAGLAPAQRTKVSAAIVQQ